MQCVIHICLLSCMKSTGYSIDSALMVDASLLYNYSSHNDNSVADSFVH